MSSQGPLSGSTFADDSGTGFIAWSNPSNAGASDDSYVTGSMVATATTHYLKATNFGFSIPSGATINGIVVEIERKESAASVARDNRVRIVKGGTIGATDKASGTEWPTSDAYASYGSSSDLWGETWTDTDINASGFGLAVSALGLGTGTASIDHVRITVHYTGGSTTVTPTTVGLALTTFAPTIRLHKIAKPTTLALVLATFAPSADISGSPVSKPSTAALVLSTFAPAVIASDHKKAIPSTAALVTAAFAPTLRTGPYVIPATRALVTAGFAPAALAPRVVRPSTLALALTTYAPAAASAREWSIQRLNLRDSA